MGNAAVWHFRLETYDENGHARRPIGVEVKGNDISGNVVNGDWVEIDKHPKPGMTLKVRRFRNLSDGSNVKATWRMFHAPLAGIWCAVRFEEFQPDVATGIWRF